MIRSLLRWFGRRARSGRPGRGSGSARRFTPRLEALEGRAVPGGVAQGVSGAALLGAEGGGPSHVILFGIGSKPGGVGDGILSGFEVLRTRGSGEEIPQ